MRIPLKYFTQEIRDEYGIMEIASDGHIHIKMRKGMYGLQEVGILAFNNVVENIVPHGYHPVKYIAGLWKHKTRKLYLYFVLTISESNIVNVSIPKYVTKSL